MTLATIASPGPLTRIVPAAEGAGEPEGVAPNCRGTAPSVIPNLKARCDRGEALLDDEKPEWPFLVDLDSLQMSNSSRCILGQTFEDDAPRGMSGFAYAHREFGKGDEWPADFGFDIHRDIEEPSEDEEFAVLGDEWRARILARRENALAGLPGGEPVEPASVQPGAAS